MRASKVTQYGVASADGGRSCAFDIGGVRVFVSGEDSGENLFVADSLRTYWNRDSEPEERPITSAADDVLALCARLLRGPVTTPRFSAGPWTPAIDDGFSWAVLNLNGTPLLLSHDAFEAALYLSRLEDGTAEVESFLIELPPDVVLAEEIRLRHWEERYRFMCPT